MNLAWNHQLITMIGS